MVPLQQNANPYFLSQRYDTSKKFYHKQSADPPICKYHPTCSDVNCTFTHPLVRFIVGRSWHSTGAMDSIVEFLKPIIDTFVIDNINFMLLGLLI